MKNNKVASYGGIQVEFWKIFCTASDENENFTKIFNKIKNGKEFPLDWKIAIMHSVCKRERKPIKSRKLQINFTFSIM
jgi:hypothetical protein